MCSKRMRNSLQSEVKWREVKWSEVKWNCKGDRVVLQWYIVESNKCSLLLPFQKLRAKF